MSDYYRVRVATFAYDYAPTDQQLAAIHAGTMDPPAQATLATGATVADAGSDYAGNPAFRGVYVLAGDEYESIAEPGVLLQTPEDSTHVVYVEQQYLESTTAPTAQGAQAGGATPVAPGAAGTVPVGSDPFGIGSLTDPTAPGQPAPLSASSLLPAIIAGIAVAVIVKYL